MGNNNKHLNKQGDDFHWFIGLLSLMIILWAASGFLINSFSNRDPSIRGTFGDMFGAINALFSGAALAGVIYAVILQRRELGLQRQELEDTREELRRAAEAQEKSERHLVQQAEALALTAKLNALGLIPTITCSGYIETSSVLFTLSNLGSTPAFDVEVDIVGSYHEDEINVKTFLRIYLVKDGRVNEPSAKKLISEFASTDEGIFSVFDSLTYPLMPQRRKVIAQLAFPTPPSGIYALLQFRDIQGNNYHQLYWLITRDLSKSGYRVGSIDPVTLDRSPRIIREVNGYNTFKMEDGSSLPDYITREFLHGWEGALPSVLVYAENIGPEDRGEWNDI